MGEIWSDKERWLLLRGTKATSLYQTRFHPSYKATFFIAPTLIGSLSTKATSLYQTRFHPSYKATFFIAPTLIGSLSTKATSLYQTGEIWSDKERWLFLRGII
jgi:hypothetical protein